MQKLEHCHDFKKPDWITEMGGYNALPKPYRRSNAHRFLHMMSTWTPNYIDHRQACLPLPVVDGDECPMCKNGTVEIVDGEIRCMGECGCIGEVSLTLRTVQLFFFHNCAFAFFLPEKWKSTPDGIRYDLSECEFFEIGCDHQYRALGVDECKRFSIQHHGNCWHVEKCEKCEHVHSYDSSG